jgi:hypothetical protein
LLVHLSQAAHMTRSDSEELLHPAVQWGLFTIPVRAGKHA